MVRVREFGRSEGQSQFEDVLGGDLGNDRVQAAQILHSKNQKPSRGTDKTLTQYHSLGE